jgi:hypothetical protein
VMRIVVVMGMFAGAVSPLKICGRCHDRFLDVLSSSLLAAVASDSKPY